MRAALRLLLCVAAMAQLLRSEEVPSEVYTSPDESTMAGFTNSTAPVGVRGYRRYFANDSLIGRPVPCTQDDKICFRHNLVFDPSTDRCQLVGGGTDRCELRLNKTELEQGRIVGVCKTYEDPCPGYRLAYDGRCYRKEVVRDVICGCEAKLIFNVLGEVECRHSTTTPIHIQQPEDEGRCLIPDLRFPDINIRVDIEDNLDTLEIGEISFKCGAAQNRCFAKNTVKVKGFKGCYKLQEQGPCPREHIVALNIHSAYKSRAVGTCVYTRSGCPQGYKRLRFDGQCHEERKLVLVDQKYVTTNEYGENLLLPQSYDFGITLFSRDYIVYEKQPNGRPPLRRVERRCVLETNIIGAWHGGFQTALMTTNCATNDKGDCRLFEVEANPPIPEF